MKTIRYYNEAELKGLIKQAVELRNLPVTSYVVVKEVKFSIYEGTDKDRIGCEVEIEEHHT